MNPDAGKRPLVTGEASLLGKLAKRGADVTTVDSWVKYIPQFAITAIFPTYSCDKSIASLVDTTVAILRKHACEFEVIIVDDCAGDGTAAMLEQLRVRYQPYVRILTHPGNRGYGAALCTGLAAARKEFIFCTDGDGQYDVGELPSLFKLIKPDVGLVNGYTLNRHDPWHRVPLGYLYNHFAKWLFGIHIREVDCDFRLIRREALNHTSQCSTNGTICVELVRMIELSPWRVLQTGVHHYAGFHSRSQFFRIRSLLTVFWQLMTLYWRLVVRPKSRQGERWTCDDPDVQSRDRAGVKLKSLVRQAHEKRGFAAGQ